jgi:NADH-quinone oxidoreductase E subunit
MSTRPISALPVAQAASVAFDAATEKQIQTVLKRYPTARAALLPVLWICQERFGWISPGVVRAVAERLSESPAFVDGVVTFYTMYRTAPPAKFVIQACVTLSCAVCGGKEIVAHLKERLGIGFGERTADATFQLEGVQCLGACGSAPVVQINDDYYENLTPAKLDAILDELGARKE